MQTGFLAQQSKQKKTTEDDDCQWSQIFPQCENDYNDNPIRRTLHTWDQTNTRNTSQQFTGKEKDMDATPNDSKYFPIYISLGENLATIMREFICVRA